MPRSTSELINLLGTAALSDVTAVRAWDGSDDSTENKGGGKHQPRYVARCGTRELSISEMEYLWLVANGASKSGNA